VIRDGRERSLDPAELVTGDVVRVAAGDQITADGRLVAGGRLEMDESLLTGEADLVPKRGGDEVLSGSFAVTGEACYEAERVGEDSHAARLTRTAREFSVSRTPLQTQIAFAVRLVTVVVALMSLAILLQAALESVPVTRVVQISAVLSGQIPYGLFFMTAVAYALGAAAIAKRGALAQQVNAIESLSNVDVLCMDKTGTLTANRLRFHALAPLDGTTTDAGRRLGEFVRSTSDANETSAALAGALPGESHEPAAQIAFASARKWSALAFEDGPRRGVWALGAVETLRPFLPARATAPGSALAEQVGAWSDAGLRTLVFAHGEGATHLSGDTLPPLQPVAVVALEDELRTRGGRDDRRLLGPRDRPQDHLGRQPADRRSARPSGGVPGRPPAGHGGRAGRALTRRLRRARA
jgi:cation-transporting P-type ATPase E